MCCINFDVYAVTYLITVYPKNEKDSLSRQECNNIKKLIDILEAELERRSHQ